MQLIKREALKWITGDDKGVSSITIWDVMTGSVNKHGWYGTPSDGGDFGRCYRLLQLVPEWRSQLHLLVEAFPAWAPLVEVWPLLEADYLADMQDNGGRVYDRIRSLPTKERTNIGGESRL